MILDLAQPHERQKFQSYATTLLERRKKVELKEIKPKRTVDQNSYMHVLFALYGIETGYTLAEIKTILKREYGLIYEKQGEKFLRSTADLDSGEMSKFIDFIRDHAGQNGCYLPTADEYKLNHAHYEYEIEKVKHLI